MLHAIGESSERDGEYCFIDFESLSKIKCKIAIKKKYNMDKEALRNGNRKNCRKSCIRISSK